jgi:hypothetical protein
MKSSPDRATIKNIMKKELKRFRLCKFKKIIASFDTYQEACDYVERLPVGQIGKCMVEDSNYFPVKKNETEN